MRALVPLLFSRRRPDALIAHMCPIYLVLAAPLAKLVAMPLDLVHALGDRLGASGRDGARRRRAQRRPSLLPIDGPRCSASVTASTSRSSPPATRSGSERDSAPARARAYVALERFRHACGSLRPRLARRGRAASRDSRRVDHRRGAASSRRARGADRGGGAGGCVTLDEPVPRPPSPSSSARPTPSSTRLGPAAGGALDKVVYESAACAVPVMACNPDFDEFLGELPVELLFESATRPTLPSDSWIRRRGRRQRETAGLELRRRVATGHSVDSWADAVVATVRRLQTE